MTKEVAPSALWDSMTDQQKIEWLGEEWRPIFRYRGMYWISNLGNVRSYKNNGFSPTQKPRTLKFNVRRGSGYRYVQLRRRGKTYMHKVSRLVAEAFLPNPLDLPIVNHKDGVKTNDKTTNLEWCTQSHNLCHAYRTGLKIPVRGIDSKHAKLTEENVREIRKKYGSGSSCSMRDLARQFNVCHTTIISIIKYSKWKHI